MKGLCCLLLGAAVALNGADGTGALHWAAYHDDLEGVRSSIRGGADVNAVTDLGVTPLWTACQNGSSEVVRILLDAGAKPDLALGSGETPLMVAARSGYAEIVAMLLRKGADPNVRATRAQTALMWAASQKHPAVVKALVAGGADVHAKSAVWSQMMATPPHGQPEYNREIPHGGNTALMFAARVGDVESARHLVEAGANVSDKDAWGVSATALAAHSGFRDLVMFLLEKGADANAGEAGFTALHAAIMHRDEAMAAALLAHGANANAPLANWTPTRRSSRDYHFPPAYIGARPFWLAARVNSPGIVRLLAKHGADPRFVHRVEYHRDYGQPRREATTAVMAAVGIGAGVEWAELPRGQREQLVLETVRVAMELGAPAGVADLDGRTALEEARARGYPRVAEFLKSAPIAP